MLHWNVRKQNRGFTLIEILTTAIIVGVVAAIAAPNFFSMYSKYQVEEGMRQIEGAIKEAQRQAIRNGQACTIRVGDSTIDTDAANSGCLLSNRTLRLDLIIGGIPLGSAGPPTTITDAAPIPITFSSKGNTDTGSQGIFVISHDGTDTERCVQIQGLLGNIITGDYDGTTCS